MLGLTGCQTMNDMQNTFDTMFSPSEQQAQEEVTPQAQTTLATAREPGCPSVQIIDELNHLAQYQNFENPTPATSISSIDIENVKSACVIEEKAVAMNIDITFLGAVGPKGRVKSSDTANFSYPYFVAVTDPNGNILAKEIFAASVTYSAGQDQIKQIETINQLLPKAPEVADYNILLGFQLDEKQLAYNRANIKPASGTTNARTTN